LDARIPSLNLGFIGTAWRKSTGYHFWRFIYPKNWFTPGSSCQHY